ncbi:MAG: SEC-C domain-containing protein [Spirochaetales bacterium]|nr:SEC-C domain-containing protein [Spirochaetales bacterium]
MKTGRNDPCPCGSGKKYKHCCLSSNIIPFPPSSRQGEGDRSGIDSDAMAAMGGFSSVAELDEDLARYTNYCENLPDDAHIPSLMEFLGRANPATDLMSGINAKAEGRNFESIGDLNKFFGAEVETQNNRKLKEFLGLSPAQVHNLLTLSISDNEEIIKLNTEITEEDIIETPIIKRVKAFFDEFIESAERSGSLKLTSTGRLKPDFCKKYWERVTGLDSSRVRINRADDYEGLHVIAMLLAESGYMTFGKTTCRFTNKGIKQYLDKLWTKIYLELLVFYTEELDWDFLISYENTDPFQIFQDSVLFSLYLLKNKGNGREDENEIFKYFYDALLKNFFGDDETSMSITGNIYSKLVLKYFCAQFGLIDHEFLPEDNRKFSKTALVKTSPLFKKLFKWNIQNQ